MQRAEQKIVTVEGRIAEQNKAIEAEREELQARLAKLKEQLEAEQAARSFAEGALQAARQERGARRHDVEGAAPGAERAANPDQRERARQDHPPARVRPSVRDVTPKVEVRNGVEPRTSS